jgi:beta-phosphoglucomutase-like phosphatase (HAD superfamily)
MRILLFDMDGVLIEPLAYHRALRDVVDLIARAMGFSDIHITKEQIEIFESVGLTSEWDSSAICSALLYDRVWMRHPSYLLPLLPPLPHPPTHAMPTPDFEAFARSIGNDSTNLPPLVLAERILLDNSSYNESQTITLQTILRQARAPAHSLTFRLFQELVLGSRNYTEAYKLPPFTDTESYLRLFDRPVLSVETHARLKDWLAIPKHHAAIITNRPSRMPHGDGGTPEAEIGAQLCGLEELPIIGYGELSWLSARRGCGNDDFIKPSPVHVLAALRTILDESPARSVAMAAELVVDQNQDSTWAELDGSEVTVFEDSVIGIHSALAAKEILLQAGIETHWNLYGVTESEPKRAVLTSAGAVTLPTLRAALDGTLSL